MRGALWLWVCLWCSLPAAAGAANVRSDRPRLLLSNGSGPGTSLATFKQRCATDAAYKNRCQGAITTGSGLFPAIALATGYLANDDQSKCATAYQKLQTIAQDTAGQPDAHSFISNNGRAMLQLAVVRDWCDPVLSASEKTWLETKMTAWTDWYLTAPGLDVFHDDMNNVWNAVGLAGLALAGTAADAKATQYLAAADQQWKQVIFPAIGYVGDFWHEGMVYVQPAVASAAWYATAWTIATDEDLFAYAKSSANDLMNGYIAMHAYLLRPDFKYAYFGDTSSNKQSPELFSRYLIDMLTQGTGSALGQGLSLEIKAKSQPGYDYAGADGWMMALFYDTSKDAGAAAPSTLPTYRWLSKGAADVAILRSGWGKDDTFVYLSCGDYLGAHQHIESGSFQIFRHAPLTGTTGCYDAFDSDHWQNYYSQHSVHANTLAVHQPGEFFPTLQSISDPQKNVNDGGQRVLRRNKQGTGFPNPDLDSYKQHKTSEPFTETGDIGSFEHSACHDYVQCKLTQAYSSPGYLTNGNAAKVSEVTRQLVFVRPGLVVVFDRVEATEAGYDKRFLLHGYAQPTVSGSSYTLTNGNGRLFAETLLPTSPTVTTVTGFEVEGKPHPPSSTASCDEAGGARLEISPAAEAARDYFLHVFEATDASDSTPPTSQLAEDASSATVTIDDGNLKTVLTFLKTGDPGGHISVTQGGSSLCDQDLGATAIPGTGGAGGGGGSGATGPGGTAGSGASTGAGGAAGGAGTGDEDSGCGCRVAERERSFAWWSLLAALALGAARRERDRPRIGDRLGVSHATRRRHRDPRRPTRRAEVR